MIKGVPQSAGQKAIEAELTWVNCGATSGHFMNHKRQTAEKKEVRWSAHNDHTSMNVCMHDIFLIKMYLHRNGCLYECMYMCCISLYVYVCVNCIQSICVSNCTAQWSLMMYSSKSNKVCLLLLCMHYLESNKMMYIVWLGMCHIIYHTSTWSDYSWNIILDFITDMLALSNKSSIAFEFSAANNIL